MTTALLREPDDWPELDEEISNFDYSIPDGVEERLRSGGVYAAHPAWDHWGAVWFADGMFHERVMQYQRHVATLSNVVLADLIEQVNDEYGWE